MSHLQTYHKCWHNRAPVEDPDTLGDLAKKNPKTLPKINKEKGQALHQGQNNPVQHCGLQPDWVRRGPERKGLGVTSDAMQASGLPVLEDWSEAGEDPDKGKKDGARGLINMSCVETARELSLFSLLKGMLRKTQ